MSTYITFHNTDSLYSIQWHGSVTFNVLYEDEEVNMYTYYGDNDDKPTFEEAKAMANEQLELLGEE